MNQVLALAAGGANVTLICTSVDSALADKIRVHETLRILGRRVPHRVFGDANRALAYHDWCAARFLRANPTSFDVVHTWPQSTLATAKVAHSIGCLVSREVPNTHTANAFEQAGIESEIVGISLTKHHAHRADARRLALEETEYDAVDILLVPSDHVAETFEIRGVSKERLGRHQYGYDPMRFHATGRRESPDRPFTATFVGSAEPRKGLHYALEAWSESALPNGSRFLIAGAFLPGYEEYLQPWLSNTSVEQLGFVNDVPALLRQSDVLLLPSVEEGSALVTYEAQACGCIPLVSIAAGALLPPVLSSMTHQPRDVLTLRRQIFELANSESLRTSLREEVIDWAGHLTWEYAGQRMLDLYSRALAERNRGK